MEINLQNSIINFTRSYQSIKYQQSYEIIKSIAIACFAAIAVSFGMGLISGGVAIGGSALCCLLAHYHHDRKKVITDVAINDHNLRTLSPAQVEEKLKLHNRKDGKKTEFEHANEPDKLYAISPLGERNLDYDYEEDCTNWFHYGLRLAPFQGGAVVELIGKRPVMEDAHITASFNLFQTPISLYAVFDGNGGAGMANYLEENIVDHLKKELTSLTDCDITNVLKTAFVKLLSKMEDIFPGSTANVVLKIDNTLWVACVGDTRAVLCVEGKAIALSDDASADVQRFIPSVERRGGKAELWEHPQGNVWRIDSLNMARNVSHNLHIPCRPKIIKYPIENVTGKLILASDGFWDEFSSNEAASDMSRYSDCKDLAEYFAKCALLRGSSDNITVMVVDI